MDLINELGNDLALAVLVEKKHKEKLDSKEILSLIGKIREVLEPVSGRDHLYTGHIPKATSEAANSH